MDYLEKVGHYDWIVEFETIRSILESEMGSLSSFGNALVLGCGTSSVSIDLANRY
jgi:hypothetical protein